MNSRFSRRSFLASSGIIVPFAPSGLNARLQDGHSPYRQTIVQPLWTFQASDTVWTPAIPHEDRVVVASSSAEVHALDSTSGEVLWTHTADDAIGGLAGAGTVAIYVTQGERYPTAVSFDEGEVLWQSSLESIWNSPAIVHDMIYIGMSAGGIGAIDAETGETAWIYSTNDEVFGEMLAHAGRIHASTRDGVVHVVDATSGEVAWQVSPDFLPGPLKLVTDQIVLVVQAIELAGNVYQYAGLDANTGETLWQFELDTYAMGTAAHVDGMLFHVSGNRPAGKDPVLYCRDMTSLDVVWSVPVEWNVAAAGLVEVERRIHLGNQVFDAINGRLVLELEGEWPHETFVARPVIDDHATYLSTMMGMVYAYTLPD